MKRRLALSLGALVAALSFSSCSSVDHGEVVAEVNGRQLSRDQLASLTEGKTDGATVRSALTQWVRVVSLSDEVGDISTPEELLTEGNLVLAAMIPQVSAAPRPSSRRASPVARTCAWPPSPSAPRCRRRR